MPGEDLERAPTDADRARIIDAIRAAGSRLGLDEAEDRMTAALAANTVGELAVLVWDLPDTSIPVPTVPAPRTRTTLWRSASFRAHATAYSLTNGLLVGTWALTGHGFFWPFFPIAGWGIGLGMHAMGVESTARHRREKAERRAREALENPDRPSRSASRSSDRSQRSHDRSGAAGSPRSGRPLASGRTAPLDASRTSVVVMFTDIVDSTRLTAVIGDEDWARIRARHRDLLHRCYSEHGGSEVNSQGDGFLARFNSPADAVSCAIQIQMRLLDERRELGFSPTVRIGINAGEAMDEAGDLLGTVVNVAARVTALADPSEILTTEAVADRLDDRFHLDDRGLRDIKGLSRSCHVLSVRWAG